MRHNPNGLGFYIFSSRSSNVQESRQLQRASTCILATILRAYIEPMDASTSFQVLVDPSGPGTSVFNYHTNAGC
jgi:hypothetical protein